VPVNILYCEGGKNSPDIRVVRALLPRSCTGRFAGSKYNLDQKIIFAKNENFLPGSVIAGIKDRDFDNDESPPRETPREWLINSNNQMVSIGQHPFPDQFTESDCRVAIRAIVEQYKQAQIVKESDVLSKFDELLPTCRRGGFRFQNYLTFFAGKDLLCGMQTALAQFNLGSPFEFRERVIKGIENSLEEVGMWLPEWQRFRESITN
jgi:hypothetical protein